MRTTQIAALALGALALLFLFSGQRGSAQGGLAELFTVAPQGASTGVWVVDQRAGRVMLCSPPLQHNQPPDCTPWNSLQ